MPPSQPVSCEQRPDLVHSDEPRLCANSRFTNPESAQQLLISRRTVHTHLSREFTELGIRLTIHQPSRRLVSDATELVGLRSEAWWINKRKRWYVPRSKPCERLTRISDG